MSSSNQTITSLTAVSSYPAMVNESTQTTPSTKSNVLEKREVLPWTADEEMAMDEANENMDEYLRERARIEEHKEEVRRILEQNERDDQ